MKRIENFLDWLIKRPWFGGAFLILNVLIPNKIKSNKTFSLLFLCLMLLVLYRLFKLSKTGPQNFNKK
jgi:hypothetical protein